MSPVFLREGKELYKMRGRKDLDSKVNFMVVSISRWYLRHWTLFYTMLVLRSWRSTWLIPKVALAMDMPTLSLLPHTKVSFCFTVPSWSFQQFATSSPLTCQSLLNSFYTADCSVITVFLVLMHLVVCGFERLPTERNSWKCCYPARLSFSWSSCNYHLQFLCLDSLLVWLEVIVFQQYMSPNGLFLASYIVFPDTYSVRVCTRQHYQVSFETAPVSSLLADQKEIK